MKGGEGLILVVAAVPSELVAFRPGRREGLICVAGGMGARAGRSAREFLRRRSISCVVSAGFAGSASAGLRVGDLVMASDVVEESTGRRLTPPISPEGVIPGVRKGTFVTVERPLVASSDKRQRWDRFGAIAVEMETWAVASAAVEAGVPWLALRAILDPMEQPLAVASMPQGVAWLVQPWRWPAWSEFMGSVRVAGGCLARGLELLVQQVDSKS